MVVVGRRYRTVKGTQRRDGKIVKWWLVEGKWVVVMGRYTG